MNDIARQNASNEIPSLLLPVVDYQLLVPTVTIAEMMPYRKPDARDGSDWYLGDLAWRGMMVPLISFEALIGQPVADVQPNSQLAIFNNTGMIDDLAFFAIMTQGIPRLSRISQADIQQINEPAPPFCKMIVTLDGERALLPDVASLETHCGEFLGLVTA